MGRNWIVLTLSYLTVMNFNITRWRWFYGAAEFAARSSRGIEHPPAERFSDLAPVFFAESDFGWSCWDVNSCKDCSIVLTHLNASANCQEFYRAAHTQCWSVNRVYCIIMLMLAYLYRFVIVEHINVCFFCVKFYFAVFTVFSFFCF